MIRELRERAEKKRNCVEILLGKIWESKGKNDMLMENIVIG